MTRRGTMLELTNVEIHMHRRRRRKRRSHAQLNLLNEETRQGKVE
jgi:hypothetical protein